MIFHFPIYHEGCDSCKSRFECMTMRIHRELKESSFYEVIPFYFGLKCFKLEPYNRVDMVKLEVIGIKTYMKVSACWS